MTRRAWILCLLAILPLGRAGFAQDITVDIPTNVAKLIGWEADMSGAGALESLGIRDIASIQTTVTIPTRDHIRLYGTIILPNERFAKRRKFSTILIKTPYSPLSECSRFAA